MDPIAPIKSAFNVSSLVKLLAGLLIVTAALELVGWNTLLLSPIATIKGKLKGTSN